MIFEEETPPGATASGENGATLSVKFCADADASSASRVAITQRTGKCPALIFDLSLNPWSGDDSNLNMDWFK